MSPAICPIWGTPATLLKSKLVSAGNIEYFDSPSAGGEYLIDRRGRALISNRKRVGEWNADNSKQLTLWLNAQRALGIKCPRVPGRNLHLLTA